MNKYENQLPSAGRGNVKESSQGKTIDRMADQGAVGHLYSYQSSFSVSETMTRIEQVLKERKIPVFARFDHGKNAQEVGLELRPNQVIVFGSPEVGTRLMQDNPAVSIELPLKISVWEDKNGNVWAAFPILSLMAADYGLEEEPVISKMQTLLQNIVAESANGC